MLRKNDSFGYLTAQNFTKDAIMSASLETLSEYVSCSICMDFPSVLDKK